MTTAFLGYRLPKLALAALALSCLPPAAPCADVAPAVPASITAPGDSRVASSDLINDLDRKFSTSPTLSTEAIALVQMLEGYHYNRASVQGSDYAEVIPDFMATLDPDHLFYLSSDEAGFSERYGKDVYYNVKYLGNIDPAYDIYYTYHDRLTSRLSWIFKELKTNEDFTANQTFRADRSKSTWPQSTADADELWCRRLKFELLQEILNKKSPAEARDIVRKRYERTLKSVDEIEGSDLAEFYLSSIAEIYDPHSTYFSADTYEDFGIQMKLKLVGIGAVLGLEDDNCVVKEIVPGGPANLCRQVHPDDQILSVAQDGREPVDVVGMKLRKIVDMIRGDKGTRVHLVIHPASATDPSVRRQVVIVRDVVKLNSTRASAAIFQVPGADGKIVPLGVITLPAFYGPGDSPDPADQSSASKDVETLIGKLQSAGVQGIVLDLRHNGGGFLSEAINLTALFVGKGPVVQVRNSLGEIQVENNDAGHVVYSGPLAVLVDRFSASASEIVAGALQNYGRAILVGDTSTHGKGTVQTVLEMKNFSQALADADVKTGAAKITIQKFYLPDGASTQLKGVLPDITLPSVDDYLPVGESDMPHALVWDRIPTSSFSGAPVDPKVVAALRQASLARQSTLEEFAWLRKNVDWFRSREDQKLVSLNLDERRKEKTSDDEFTKEMNAEKSVIAKGDFPYQEILLAPRVPSNLKAAKKDAASGSDDDDQDSDELGTDQDETYVKADVHLRETLRILNDAVDLGRNHEYWAANHAPLTVAADKG
jgi:carboxyl-terminal processing protease